MERPLLPPYDTAYIINEIEDSEIRWLPGALDGCDGTIDPITFSVINARLEGIMSEMT